MEIKSVDTQTQFTNLRCISMTLTLHLIMCQFCVSASCCWSMPILMNVIVFCRSCTGRRWGLRSSRRLEDLKTLSTLTQSSPPEHPPVTETYQNTHVLIYEHMLIRKNKMIPVEKNLLVVLGDDVFVLYFPLEITFACLYLCVSARPDSPGIPPSANTHQLFRGFSFVATNQIQEPTVATVAPSRQEVNNINPIAQVLYVLCFIEQTANVQTPHLIKWLHSHTDWKTNGLYINHRAGQFYEPTDR